MEAEALIEDPIGILKPIKGDPLGILSQKKNSIGNTSAPTFPLSSNGLNPFQGSPQSTDLTPVLPEYRDEVRQQQEQQAHRGMIPVKIVKPAATTPQSFQVEGPARKKNSWDNLGDFVPNTVLGGLQKDAGQLLKASFIESSPMHKLGAGLEGLGKEHQETANEHQLPNTTVGNIASTATNFTPDLLELALTPELDIAKIGKLGDVLTKYGGKYAPKIANALGGKFPVLMGTKGLTSGYSDAKDKGATDYDAMKDALVKSAEEYGKGVLFEGAGKAAEKVSDLGKKLLEDNGWMAGNKIVAGAQKAIVNSTAQAAGFSSVPFITNAVQGKTTSAEELKNNAIFGGLVGLFHGEHPKDSEAPTPADGAAKEVLQRSPLIDMHNFMSADMDAIKQVHGMEETPLDLQMKSASHAENAFKEEDPEEKQQQIIQSSVSGKASSVKAVTQAILKDKDGLINSLPDDIDKQPIIDKINQVYKELDPTEQKKTAIGNQINDIDEQIKSVTDSKPEDAVTQAENEVKLETLTKQREELNNGLKELIIKQTENSPIKPTENEKSTEEHEETEASQEKNGKGSDESSESSQDGEKSNDVNQTGGAETSPVIKPKEDATKEISQQKSGGDEHQAGNESGETPKTGNSNKPVSTEESKGTEKPRFQIKQGKVVPLPLKEHAELNAMLKADHGITIQDIKDEQSQRNASGDQNTETPTDAEAVRQPEDDGAGNVGKNRPSETTQSAESGKNPSETVGVANADVSKERGQEVERTHKTREEIENEGKRLINDGELDPDKFAKEIIDSPKPITAEEQAALRYHKTKLNNKQRALIKDTEANPDNASDNKIEYARNEDLIEQNRKATEIAGNETGRALGDRTAQLAEDYSRVNVLNRAKMANNGEPLDPKDEAELEMRTKRIQELEGKLADREEELRKAIENGLVDKVNRAANHEERQAKREVTKATLRKEREGLVAELHLIAKKSMGAAGANKIPVDMIVPLTKLARNYVLDGVATLSGVVDKLYDDLKEHVEGLKRDEIADVIKDNFSQYLSEQNAVRLERSKKLQKTKLEKLKEGTFEKKTYGKIQVDNDYLNIRAEINREQMKINKKIADIENSQKNIGRKALDFAVKWGRQLKLASITVLGKLTAAGLTTVGIEPVNEGVGKVASKLAKKISKNIHNPETNYIASQASVSRSAMKEASEVTEGQAVKSLSEAYARAATKGMKDAYDEARAAGSTLSALYSDKKGRLPPEAAEFFGHLHSAIKAPVKRFAFEKSYAKRVARTIEAGLDPLDPVIDARNRLDAYKDAERAIFMGDNWLASQYENVTGQAERSKFSSVRTVGGIARILFPFVKVPTNIVLETARYAGGLAPGLGKIAQVSSSTLARQAGAEGLARIIHKGMGKLTPEESDIVLRNLKRGSVGGAALALGFINPKAVGGFYQPGENRKKNEVNADSFMIDGHKVPMWLTEHPIFQAMQIGATFKRLLEAHKHKDDKYEAAALGTLSGISQNIPLAEGAKQITEALGGTKKLNTYIASVIKGETIPAFLQQLAIVTDTKDGSLFSFEDKNQNERAPNKKHGLGKMIKQTLETGVPGLREDVPKKH